MVHTSHGWLFGNRPHSAAGFFYRLIESLAARVSARVIAVSESEYLMARQLKVIEPDKMVVIHNGIVISGSEPQADPEKEPPTMIMVARFEMPKDHHTLLLALAGLTDYSWSLKLIGEGKLKDQVIRQAADLGIADRIQFMGMRGDIEQILSGCQVYLLITRREGFPISILEAMRAGFPVVASDVGGVAEAVQDGQSGYLVIPGDVQDLRAKLALLLRDPQLRRSMGQAGRKLLQEKFTLERMVEETKALYQTLCREEAEALTRAGRNVQ